MALKEDIKRLQGVVTAVNDLVKMNLMQELTAEPNVYVVGSVLQLKDAKYLRNWCQNILRVWAMTYKSKNISAVELVLFDKDSGDLICRYSENKGLLFS